MTRIYLSTQPFPQVSLKEMAEKAREWGYNGGLEVVIRRSGPTSLSNLMMRGFDGLRSADIIHAPTMWSQGRSFTTSLTQGLLAAAHLKALLIVIHPRSQHWLVGGQRQQQLALKGIPLWEKAQGRLIAVEVLAPPPKLSFGEKWWPPNWRKHLSRPFNHPRDWIAAVHEYNLHAVMDTTHLAAWGMETGEMVTYLRRLGSRLVHVHLSDYDSSTGKQHVIPGRGTIDWPHFLGALQEHAPDASISVELSKRYNQSLSTFTDKAAQESIDFLRELIK